MSNNINDLFANLNVPDDVKQMINNGSSNDLNNLLSQVSPEMINNLSNILNSNAQTSSQNSSNQNINNSTPNNNNNFNCSKPINGCFFFGPNIWYTSNIKERKNITLYNCWIISFYNATNRIKHRFICNRQNNNKYQHFSGHNLIINCYRNDYIEF